VFRDPEYRTHPELKDVRFPSVETFIATKAAAALFKNGSETHSTSS